MTSALLTLRAIPPTFCPALCVADDATPSTGTWICVVERAHLSPLDFSTDLDFPARPHGISRTVGVVAHSADRLAGAIILATRSPRDPRTLADWGQQVGVSRGALRVWCKAAGVSARSCLDFLRILRAVILAEHQAWNFLEVLDVVDRRSLIQLLDRGGVRELCLEQRPTTQAFMASQRFVESEAVLQAVASRLGTKRE